MYLSRPDPITEQLRNAVWIARREYEEAHEEWQKWEKLQKALPLQGSSRLQVVNLKLTQARNRYGEALNQLSRHLLR